MDVILVSDLKTEEFISVDDETHTPSHLTWRVAWSLRDNLSFRGSSIFLNLLICQRITALFLLFRHVPIPTV